jgi:hypothetical protein
MDGGLGQLRIHHGWDTVHAQHVCQIAWTHEQLQRIEQALEEGDKVFLATVEAAIRRALEAALRPPSGRKLRGRHGSGE